MQITMVKFGSLPGLKPPSESDSKELLVVRETYELACTQISLQLKDVPGFERHMAQVTFNIVRNSNIADVIFADPPRANTGQVKTLYTDYAGVLPKSAKQYELQGLNLLSLLAQNKIAEFHTELELLPVRVVEQCIVCMALPRTTLIWRTFRMLM